jgi:hypothetical protein
LRYSSVCVSPERGDTGLSSYSKPSSFSIHCAHPSQPAVNQQHAQGVPLLQALTTQRPERNSGLPHSTRAIAAVLYVGPVLLTERPVLLTERWRSEFLLHKSHRSHGADIALLCVLVFAPPCSLQR